MKRFYCSFCGKSSHEVRVMVAGNMDTSICNECVAVCDGIIAQHNDPGRIEYESWAQHLKPTAAQPNKPLRAAQERGCPECGWGKVAGCWRCGSL